MSFLIFLSHSRHSKWVRYQRRKCILFKSRLGNSTSINACDFLSLTAQRVSYFNGIQEATLNATSNGEVTAVPVTGQDYYKYTGHTQVEKTLLKSDNLF